MASTKIKLLLGATCTLLLMSCGTGKKGFKVHLLHSQRLELRQVLNTGHHKSIQKAEPVNMDYVWPSVMNNVRPFELGLDPEVIFIISVAPSRQESVKPAKLSQKTLHFAAISNLPLVFNALQRAEKMPQTENTNPTAPRQNRNTFWLFLLFFVAGVLFFELSLLLFPWTFIAGLVRVVGFFNVLISSEFMIAWMHEIGMVRARTFWYLFLAIAIAATLFFTLGAYAMVAAAMAMFFTTTGILAVCLGFVSLFYAFTCKFDKNDPWFN